MAEKIENIAASIVTTRSAAGGIIDEMAQRETERLLTSMSEGSEPSGAMLENAAGSARRRLLAEILTVEFMTVMGFTQELSDTDFQALAYDMRRLATPLHVPIPDPVIEPRRSSMALAAGFGALTGMLGLTPLMRLLLGNAETGMVVGAPLGAAVFVLFLDYLARRKAVLRTIQGVLGVASVAEVSLAVTRLVNPVSHMWRFLTGRFGGGLLGTIKRLAYMIGGILVLQLAVPRPKIAREQLRKNAEAAIAAWLKHHADLLVFLLTTIPWRKEPEAGKQSARLPANLVDSIAKLSMARESGEIGEIAREVLQEFSNAGFVIGSGDARETYSDSMLDTYDVVGLINEGDPYRVLKEPVFEGDRVAIKGRITRKRD